jgi:hypothetical protein
MLESWTSRIFTFSNKDTSNELGAGQVDVRRTRLQSARHTGGDPRVAGRTVTGKKKFELAGFIENDQCRNCGSCLSWLGEFVLFSPPIQQGKSQAQGFDPDHYTQRGETADA